MNLTDLAWKASCLKSEWGGPQDHGRDPGKLLELVASNTRDLQYPFSTWTAELLALTLKEQTGLVVSESWVRRTLHRQGYSVQLPVLSVSSPDPDYEQKAARLQELQQRALTGEIDLYYEVDLVLLLGVMRCWSKQGQ